jgi:hypothetical protein
LKDPIWEKKIQHEKGLVEWLKWQEHLPSKHEALSSNASSEKKNEKKKNPKLCIFPVFIPGLD